MHGKDKRIAFTRAKQQFDEKEFETALESLNELDIKDLNYDDKSLILHYKALCHSHLKDFKASMSCFEKAKAENPDDFLIPFNQGLTYFFHAQNQKTPKGYLRMAVSCFKHALEKNASSTDAWYYRGYMHKLLKENDLARYSYRKVFSLTPRFQNAQSCELYEEMYVKIHLSAKKLPDNIHCE